MHPRLASLPFLLITLVRLPAATWNGAGDGFSWTDQANWDSGLRPISGETVWINPVAGVTRVEVGAASDGGAIGGLVLAGAEGLEVRLLDGAGVASVRSIGTASHRFEGLGLAEGSEWNVDAGGSVSWATLPDWTDLDWTGQGELRLAHASAASPGPLNLRVSAGNVHFVGPQEGVLDLTSVTLEGGSLSFDDQVSWLGEVTYRSGSFGMMSMESLWVGGFRLDVAGDIDLNALNPISASEVRLRSTGTITSGTAVAGSVVILEGGILDLSGGELQAALVIEGGMVRGGAVANEVRMTGGALATTVTGYLTVADAEVAMEDAVIAGTLRMGGATVEGAARIEGEVMLEGAGAAIWVGDVALAEGAVIRWYPSEEEAASMSLAGAWTAEGGLTLAIGETDWTSPYWGSVRQMRLVDLWEGGSLAASFTLAEGGKAGFGEWTLGEAEDGTPLMLWTPGLLAVPEPSHLAPVAALALLAVSARRRRARRR
jgi:hypothetical protein